MQRPRMTRRYRRRTARVRVQYDAPDGPHTETATTLGAGGMFIATDEPLPEQTILKLTFQLAPGEQTYEMQGRVIWANRPEDEHVRAPGMGIEFTNPAACGELARALEGLPADQPTDS